MMKTLITPEIKHGTLIIHWNLKYRLLNYQLNWTLFTKALQQPAKDSEQAVPSALVSFGSMLAQVDIPEEPGNVVVLYEICWFSLARSEWPRGAEHLITAHVWMGPVMYWRGRKNVFPESVSAAWILFYRKGVGLGNMVLWRVFVFKRVTSVWLPCCMSHYVFVISSEIMSGLFCWVCV